MKEQLVTCGEKNMDERKMLCKFKRIRERVIETSPKITNVLFSILT